MLIDKQIDFEMYKCSENLAMWLWMAMLALSGNKGRGPAWYVAAWRISIYSSMMMMRRRMMIMLMLTMMMMMIMMSVNTKGTSGHLGNWHCLETPGKGRKSPGG